MNKVFKLVLQRKRVASVSPGLPLVLDELEGMHARAPALHQLLSLHLR